MLKVIFVGLGWAARTLWIPRFLAMGQCQVIAAFDPSEDARAAASELVPGIRFADTVEELAQVGADLAVISSPNALHVEHAVCFLERGVAVLIEKPACINHTDYLSLLQAVERSSAHCFISTAASYRDDVQILGRLVRECGNLPTLIEVEWIRSRGIPKPGSWFTHRALAGGGVLQDLGWHLLSVAFGLMDLGKPIGGIAAFSDVFLRADTKSQANWRADVVQRGALKVDVEDNVAGFLTTESGTSIAIKAAWASYIETDTTRVAVVCGNTRFVLETTFGFSPNRIHAPFLTIESGAQKQAYPIKHAGIGDEYTAMMQDVCYKMRTERTLDGIRCIEPVVQAIEMLYRSQPGRESI